MIQVLQSDGGNVFHSRVPLDLANFEATLRVGQELEIPASSDSNLPSANFDVGAMAKEKRLEFYGMGWQVDRWLLRLSAQGPGESGRHRVTVSFTDRLGRPLPVRKHSGVGQAALSRVQRSPDGRGPQSRDLGQADGCRTQNSERATAQFRLCQACRPKGRANHQKRVATTLTD